MDDYHDGQECQQEKVDKGGEAHGSHDNMLNLPSSKPMMMAPNDDKEKKTKTISMTSIRTINGTTMMATNVIEISDSPLSGSDDDGGGGTSFAIIVWRV